MVPIKFVNQKHVLSPKAPPHVNDDRLKTNSSNSDEKAMIATMFLLNMKKDINDFLLNKSTPSFKRRHIVSMDGKPKP